MQFLLLKTNSILRFKKLKQKVLNPLPINIINKKHIAMIDNTTPKKKAKRPDGGNNVDKIQAIRNITKPTIPPGI